MITIMPGDRAPASHSPLYIDHLPRPDPQSLLHPPAMFRAPASHSPLYIDHLPRP